MSIKRKRKLLSKSVKSLAEINKENEKLEKKLALIKEEQDLPNSNFTIVKFATDANGNRVVRLKNNTSGKKFSIQTNGNLPKTHRHSIADVKVDDLTPEEIAEVSKEVVDFVSNYGTKAQKTGLLGEVSESVVEEEIVTEDTEIDLNDPENIDFKNGLLEIIEYYEAELQSGETSDPEMIAMFEDEIKGAKEWLDNGFIPSNGLEEESVVTEKKINKRDSKEFNEYVLKAFSDVGFEDKGGGYFQYGDMITAHVDTDDSEIYSVFLKFIKDIPKFANNQYSGKHNFHLTNEENVTEAINQFEYWYQDIEEYITNVVNDVVTEATKLDEPTRTVFTVQGDNIVRINQFSEEEQEENMVFLSFDSIKKMAEELNP